MWRKKNEILIYTRICTHINTEQKSTVEINVLIIIDSKPINVVIISIILRKLLVCLQVLEYYICIVNQ